MPAVTDEELYADATRVNGKVVIITGGANGFGRASSLLFAKHGAKVVIGDLNDEAAGSVVAEITQAGGQAIWQHCDVTNWDDQCKLFELASAKFGSVDIVIANAGVSEIGTFHRTKVQDGQIQKPSTKTIEVNLVGVIYTSHLALHYMKQGSEQGSLKSLVLLGSMASWQSIAGVPLYSASKHAVLGFMRSLYLPCMHSGIRLAVIHPFFSDTGILPKATLVALAGMTLTPISRVAGAIFRAATDPDIATSGCPWLLPDGGEVFRLEREELKEGVYEIIDVRTKAAFAGITRIKHAYNITKDITRLLWRQFVILGLVIATARLAYAYINGQGYDLNAMSRVEGIVDLGTMTSRFGKMRDLAQSQLDGYQEKMAESIYEWL